MRPADQISDRSDKNRAQNLKRKTRNIRNKILKIELKTICLHLYRLLIRLNNTYCSGSVGLSALRCYHRISISYRILH